MLVDRKKRGMIGTWELMVAVGAGVGIAGRAAAGGEMLGCVGAVLSEPRRGTLSAGASPALSAEASPALGVRGRRAGPALEL